MIFSRFGPFFINRNYCLSTLKAQPLEENAVLRCSSFMLSFACKRCLDGDKKWSSCHKTHPQKYPTLCVCVCVCICFCFIGCDSVRLQIGFSSPIFDWSNPFHYMWNGHVWSLNFFNSFWNLGLAEEPITRGMILVKYLSPRRNQSNLTYLVGFLN
jgi:hypothetical protein